MIGDIIKVSQFSSQTNSKETVNVSCSMCAKRNQVDIDSQQTQKITEFIKSGKTEKWILEDYFRLTKNSAKWREYREIIRDIKRSQNNDNFTPYQWMP